MNTSKSKNHQQQPQAEQDTCAITTPLISVIICTYNRADFLAAALKTVCAQTLCTAEYEVIVVNNNSTDDTATVAQRIAQKHPNVRLYRELQQGLSHARNRGWQEANGKYVAYIDDDCTVPPEWLSEAKAVIMRMAPGVFGGPFFAAYTTPKPAWFKDEYGSHIPYAQATHIQGTEGGLYGGNLFVTRSLLEQVGGFNPQLGMAGEKMAYGEETAMVRAIYAMQPETLLYYDPKLWVYHAVRPEKMNIRWLMRQRFTNARYMTRIANEKPPRISRIGLLLRIGKAGLRFLFSLTIEALFWNRKRFPHFQNYLYENAFQHLFALGSLYEQYDQVKSRKTETTMEKTYLRQ